MLDLLGVEPGRICGSLARRLGLLAAVAPYELAARLAQLLLGVTIRAMGVWRVAQRLGQAAADYREALSQYHADSRSEGSLAAETPPAVVLGVDGCTLGMQVRPHRRRRVGTEPLPALPPVEEGHFREVKNGVLLLPGERVETSPGRRSVVRRFLVTCLGEADEIFRRLYAPLRELGWVGTHTVVVIVGDGAEWLRFVPVTAQKRPAIVDALCRRYRLVGDEELLRPLLTVATFVFDFLCIHPFRDGNRRIRRYFSAASIAGQLARPA